MGRIRIKNKSTRLLDPDNPSPYDPVFIDAAVKDLQAAGFTLLPNRHWLAPERFRSVAELSDRDYNKVLLLFGRGYGLVDFPANDSKPKE